MMSYSAESLNPSHWYRRIVFRRVYLGQAVKRQNAIRTLQNYYNQRQLLGSRLQSDKHVFDLLFHSHTTVSNNLSHGAAKHRLIMLKHSVAPYLGFQFPCALMDFRNGLKESQDLLFLSLWLSLTLSHTQTFKL